MHCIHRTEGSPCLEEITQRQDPHRLKSRRLTYMHMAVKVLVFFFSANICWNCLWWTLTPVAQLCQVVLQVRHPQFPLFTTTAGCHDLLLSRMGEYGCTRKDLLSDNAGLWSSLLSCIPAITLWCQLGFPSWTHFPTCNPSGNVIFYLGFNASSSSMMFYW